MLVAGADTFKKGASALGPFAKGVKYMVVDIGGELFNFLSRQERNSFRLLLSIYG